MPCPAILTFGSIWTLKSKSRDEGNKVEETRMIDPIDGFGRYFTRILSEYLLHCDGFSQQSEYSASTVSKSIGISSRSMLFRLGCMP